MSLPEGVRKEVYGRVWAEADRIGWIRLSPSAKSRQYENWSRDRTVGGVLERFIDRRHVRTYLKDSILRDYARDRHASPDRPFRVLGISDGTEIAEIYEKPHGRRLEDGRIVAWGRAADWKAILLAVHERAHENKRYTPHGVVFFDAVGRYAEHRVRNIVNDAARKLNIDAYWLEM